MRALACLVCFLVLAAPAAAKGLLDARLCGRDACVALASPVYPVLVEGTFVSGGRTPLGKHFQLRFAGPEDRFTTRFVPATGLVRNTAGRWMRMDPAVERLLYDSSAGLEPFGRRPALVSWVRALVRRLSAT